jgi:hypothetical protein
MSIPFDDEVEDAQQTEDKLDMDEQLKNENEKVQ